MTICYKVDNSLYINITNACTNRCDFCIRNNGDGAYGSDSLWLEREPSVLEIKTAIAAATPRKYDELVFCGYGEPTCRLGTMLQVCEWLRKEYPEIKIRLNTNGHASLIAKQNVAQRFKGLFDTISISLNASNAQDYQRICHSAYGEAAYDGMLTFAKEVKDYVPRVILSVVDAALTEEDIKKCYVIAENAGVELRVRKYISKQ